MTRKKTDHRKQERMARLMIRIAARSSRNQTLLDQGPHGHHHRCR